MPSISAPAGLPKQSLQEQGLRERKKAQTRAAFVDAATQLFAERGYDAVTVEDICAAVDVSTRTFFRYFATKADLVFAEVHRLLAGMLTDLRERPAVEPPWDSLTHALLATAEHITARRAQHIALHAVIAAAPELVAENAGALMQWEQAVTDEVRRRLPPGSRPHARLLVGVALTAFRVGVDNWVEHDGRGQARRQVGANLDLVGAVAQRLGATAPDSA